MNHTSRLSDPDLVALQNWHVIKIRQCRQHGSDKIFQVKLQEYVNRELPYVQAGFRKGRGTRDQIANIRWIHLEQRFPISTGLTR